MQSIRFIRVVLNYETKSKRNETKRINYKQILSGTYKVRNETKRNETKRNQRKRSETKRNEINKSETKRNEINEMKTK